MKRIKSPYRMLVWGFTCLMGLLCTFPAAAQSADTLFTLSDVSEEFTYSELMSSDTVKAIHKPDPSKAIWYSALCPGLGQLYNRRYWKLPVIAAGIAGISYAINWNSKYYVAYTNAYRDISDNNPTTESYLKLLPPGYEFNTSQLTNILKNRQQKYRRTRDLSYISAVGLYLICILDAYVDAHLYDFDISPDLSAVPAIPGDGFGNVRTLELRLSYRF